MKTNLSAKAITKGLCFLFSFLIISQSAFAVVTGDTVVCKSEVVSYSVPASGTYLWTVVNGNVLGSPTTNPVNIQWGNTGAGTIVVTTTSPTATYTLNVFVYPNPAPNISHAPYPTCPADRGQGGVSIPDDGSACEKVCKNAVITYSTPLVAGSSYLWVISGAASFTGQFTNSVTVTWDTTSTGLITVFETNMYGCVDSSEICIEKVDLPVAGFTHQSNVCRNSPVSFTNTSSGATSYQWNFGDGGTSTATNPTHSYSTAGNYTITLIAINDCFCKDTFQSTITVDSLPGPDITCPSTLCADQTATYTTSATGCIYNWFVTGGTIVGPNNLQSVTVLWGPGQLGTLGLVVSGCGGICSDTTFVTIPIVPLVGTITGPAKVCPGSCETYSLPRFSGASYTWSLGGSGTCGTITGDTVCCETIEICWSPNPYLSCNDTLTVTYFDSILNCGGSASYIIRARPDLAIGGDKIACANGSTNYTSVFGQPCFWSITPPGPILNPGPITTTTVNWNGFTGNFIIKAVPQNPNQSCKDTAYYFVKTVAPPAAPVITGDTVVCANSPYSYCATGTYTVQWSIIGGTPVATTGNCITVLWGATPPFILKAYQVLPTSPFCVSDTTTQNVYPILSIPTPALNGATSACANTINNSYSTSTLYPAGTTYTWSIAPANAGSITSGQGSPNILIEWGNNAPQTVTVTLTVSACSQTASNTINVSLNPAPVLTVTQLSSLCAGGTAQLQVSGALTYVWSNGTTSNITTITSNGLYQVTGTAANGCTALSQITVDYVSGPIASISTADPLTFCLGNAFSVTMCALGNPNYTYLWSNGATTQCITVSSAGTYSVMVTDITNGCMTVSNTLTVSVITCNGGGGNCTPDPTASVSFTHTLCNPITFTNTSVNAFNYSWTFGDGNSSGATSPTHNYSQAGFYLVTLTADVTNMTPPPTNCQLSDTAHIEIPLAAKFDTTTNCFGLPFCFTDMSTFTAGNNITSWNWNFGDANTSILQSPCHTYATSGTFTVTLTVSNGTCSHSYSQTITVPAKPTAAFNFSSPNCINTPVQFTDASFSSINYWEWDFGDGGSSLLQSPYHSFNPANTYPVTLIVHDISGCYDTVQQNITIVAPSISGNISASDTVVCAGTPVLLVAPACGSCTYLWSTGSTNDSITVTLTGFYFVTITDANGCPYVTSIKILVNNAPPAIITSTNGDEICLGEYTYLSVPMGPNRTYLWSSTDIAVNGQTTGSVYVSPAFAGVYNYSVIVTDTSTGCADTSLTFILTVRTPPVPPVITALGSSTICNGDTVILVGSHPDTTVTLKWSTGEVTDTIQVTKNGCYTLFATDTNGCTSFAIHCVTVNPLPYLCSFYEGCMDTCSPFLIKGPLGGTTYQWLLNGNILPGDTFQNYTATVNGLYSVIVTNSYGCTDTTGDLDLSLYPCPEDSSCATLHIDSVYCDANGNYVLLYQVTNNSPDTIDEVGLQILPPNLGVAYAPNLNFVSIPSGGTSPVLSATIYNASVGDTLCFQTYLYKYDDDTTGQGNCCKKLCCKSDTVCVTLPPCKNFPIDSTCLVSHDDSICVGQSATFTYTGNYNAVTYDWQFPNGVPNTATGPGPHTVTYNTPGCHSYILILNNVLPGTVDCVDSICVFPPPVATVTQVGNSLQAGPSGMSYQWFEQNPNWTLLSGETNQFFNPSYSTLFCVEVTSQYGCKDTACIDHQWMSVEETENAAWSVFPNPNDGSFTLSFTALKTETLEMKVLNVMGETIDRRMFDVKSGDNQFFISNQHFATGVYFVQLHTERGKYVRRVLVNR
jgi:PKD repeat protein